MIRRVSAILRHAVKNFWRIDGAQWAGAFAHYAFFALFPVIILFVTLASIFIDRDQAGAQIIAFVETYVPIGDCLASTISAAGDFHSCRSLGLIISPP